MLSLSFNEMKLVLKKEIGYIVLAVYLNYINDENNRKAGMLKET